jgi:phosphoglycolate phosphatase|tara:strand:- start:50 stop:712 length:663 start_codon:yes stop_codon:yes gene_type:complete
MTKKTHTAILFDLDGTLLDTANDLGAALNHVLVQHDMEKVTKERFRPVASDGAKGLLELGFGELLQHYDYEMLRKEFLNYYQENIAVHTCFYPGIEELLTNLIDNNIPWGVVTNKPIGLTLDLLPHFSLFSYCNSIVGGDSLKEKKPHPAPLLHACKEMDVDATACIYVGDAIRDIEAGNAAKMYTVIAQWGYILDKSSCENWQADLIAVDAYKISQIIL